jgi:hypothetical protein
MRRDNRRDRFFLANRRFPNNGWDGSEDAMTRHLFTAVAVVATLVLGSGLALADDVSFVKVDLSSQKITVKVGDAPNTEEKTLDAKRVKLTNSSGKDVKLEEFDKLREGARLEYKAQKGQITELKIPAVSKN